MAIRRFSHLGICVTDLERSLRFYRDGLGFREVGALDVEGPEASRLLELPAVRLRAVYLERDGVRIELLAYAEPGATGEPRARSMNQLGLTHVSLRVDDLDVAARALEHAGGVVLAQTRIDNPALRSSAVFATDPDGTRIELVQSE